jgi:hypothetical protein
MGGGGGEGVARPQPMSTVVQCAHGAQINFRDLKIYLTYVSNASAVKAVIIQILSSIEKKYSNACLFCRL